jgi:hypothetical protein
MYTVFCYRREEMEGFGGCVEESERVILTFHPHPASFAGMLSLKGEGGGDLPTRK